MWTHHSLPRFLTLALILFVAQALFAAGSPVTMRETQIVIPTYLAGEPEPNPMFFFGRQSQGAQGPVYPYPMYDSLTGKKVDKSYTIVYLENEYVRIGILPEIGGRLFEGLDKTNGYNFIYRQHVIKPALIGLIGAWISGGIEWNVPHHHRASTFIPVQYRLEEGTDGAKTVWVGEIELRDRMRWAVGYTLRPGSSVLETTLRVVNRTAEANSMLCFANAAVHANENYQVIFPPTTQFGVHHAKREFTEWPISHSMYGGADFRQGVDISWYKNHINANSVFAWNYDDDFVAGYDHGKHAGTMSVSDHHLVPGKKFWTWGNGPSGKRWDAILTDEDGPYIELMVGAYSDNQPDYSWLQPFETRHFSIYWYPFREIDGVKRANLDAAVNLEVKDGEAVVGFYTTAAHTGAKVTLKAGDRVLLEKTIAIDPGKAFGERVKLPAGVDEHALVASLSDGGKELVSYRPVRLEKKAKPPVVEPPPAPGEVKTIEELYLIGLRARQFHSPSVDPMDYWREALRRDPNDERVNTIVGIVAYSQARYAEAEQHLRKAVARVTADYTSPRDAEPLYYLGVTLQAEGKFDEAAEWLHKASWSTQWKSPAYFALAQLAAGRGDAGAALADVTRALENNTLNLRANNLKAALLRHLGRTEEALAVLAGPSHAADPLDGRALAERYLTKPTANGAKALAAEMNRHPGTAQSVAAEYLMEGQWQDGATVLEQMIAGAPDKSRIHPMAYYYLGYFAAKLGDGAKATEAYRQAMAMPAEYVFPFQPEAIPVLRAAMKANSRDARAPFYLGNLLYDWQPEEAIRVWEASAAIDPSFAIVQRNLAVAYMHLPGGPDAARAIAALEKAVAVAKPYPLHFTELDEIYESTGASLEKRLALFAKNPEAVSRRDDAMNRVLALEVAAGQLDKALETMTQRTFAVAEGVNLNVVEHWANAHVWRARKRIETKQFNEALADLRAAATTPENLPVDNLRDVGNRTAELAWWRGVALEGLGKGQEARAAFEESATAAERAPRRRPGNADGPTAVTDNAYYRGLALRKLGREAEARTQFESLLAYAQAELGRLNGAAGSGSARVPFRLSARAREANARYLEGLGNLGLNRVAEARAAFSKAIDLRADLVGARMELASAGR